MSTLQYEISAWASETFPDSEVPGVMAHLIEEFEELFEAAQRAEGARLDFPRAQDDTYSLAVEDFAGECADVMHLLFQLADLYEFDLLNVTRKKFEINKMRTWGKADDNGVVRHVEVTT